MSNPIALSTPTDLPLKAVIIYDDITPVADTEAILRRIGSRPGVKVQWEVFECPADSLTEPARMDQFIMRSSDAHLIVVPASYAQSPPSRFLEVLKEWAKRRRIADAALAFIGVSGSVGYGQRLSSSLSAFVNEHRLNVIISKYSDAGHARQRVDHSEVRAQIPA